MIFFKHKWPWITKTILRKENKMEYHIPWFQTYLKATVIKPVWIQQKNRHICQYSSTESPEMNPLLYGQLIYNRRSKNIQWGKYNLPNESCWENWRATCERLKLAYFLRPRTKISQEWFKDLNVRPETTKLREENIGSKLFDIYLSNCFWYFSGKGDKSKINKWDYTKLRSFHRVKWTINKARRPHTEWLKDVFCLDSGMGP